MKALRLPGFLAFSALMLAIGCASSGRVTDGDDDDDDDTNQSSSGATSGGGGSSGSTSGGSSSGGGIDLSSSSGNPQTEIAEVFVHSKDTLFRLDPDNLAVTRVGGFSCTSDSVIDIALNDVGDMYGTTFKGLYKIDKDTGNCSAVRVLANNSSQSYPNSLSFVPRGTLDANAEALVGFDEADYIRIDPSTGFITTVRANALGSQLVSSGDIVSVRAGNNLTYLTVKPRDANKCTGDCAPCKDFDCLVQIDPANGTLIRNFGSVRRTRVYGLAFWAGTVYGVNTNREIFTIKQENGQLVVQNVTVPANLGDVEYYGAGSTTSAPLGPN